MASPEHHGRPSRERPFVAGAGQGAVALVDDDPHIAHALAMWLQILGYACSLHTSGGSLLGSLALQDGQAWVPVQGPQAVWRSDKVQAPASSRMAPMVAAVMDLTLNDLSGFELAQRLQALALAVPLVVITAATTDELARYGDMPVGVQCLRKPFRLEELEQALQLR